MRIVHGNVGSKCVDKEDRHAKERMMDGLLIKPEIIKYGTTEEVKKLLNKTLDYIEYKESL